jgi:hypothetical protein
MTFWRKQNNRDAKSISACSGMRKDDKVSTVDMEGSENIVYDIVMGGSQHGHGDRTSDIMNS